MFLHLITFGGHPASCAAGLKNLEIYERENLVENSKDNGDYLLNKLEDLKKSKIVGDVRGLGLLAAIELVKDKKTKEKLPAAMEIQKKIPKYLNESNIFTFRAGDIISLCPPLNINKDEIDFLVEGLSSAISRIEKEL
jgi:adenosylmethionine-8-amino-7-oxononanoate aminotransferase